MRTLEGKLTSEGQKIAFVVARFNELITSKLLEGGKDCFLRHGGNEADMDIIYVPGAYEIPLAAKKAAQSGNYSSVVCLGAVIRGDTPHFDYVAGEAAKGVSQAAMESEVPVIFGVLTTNTLEQALERSGVKSGNKGWETTLAGIEMANLMRKLSEA